MVLKFYLAALTVALIALWLFTVIQNSDFVELKQNQTILLDNESYTRENADSLTLGTVHELEREISFLEAEINYLQAKIELLENRIDDLVFNVPNYPIR